MATCDFDRCTNEGDVLEYPDGTLVTVCWDHRRAMGFCLGCGAFCGGIESYHFLEPVGYCDDCKGDVDIFPDLRHQWEDWELWAEMEGLE